MKYSGALGTIQDRIGINFSHFPKLNPVGREVAGLVQAVRGLESIAGHKSPAETEGQHAKRVAGAAQKLKAATEKAQERISETMVIAERELNIAIAERAKLTPTPDAREVREVLRSMSSKQAKSVLFDAVRNSDSRILAAVAEGCPLTTGVDAELSARLMDQYTEKMAPDETKELAALAKLRQEYPVALQTASRAAQSAVDPDFIAKIAAEEEVANQAQQEFDGVVA